MERVYKVKEKELTLFLKIEGNDGGETTTTDPNPTPESRPETQHEIWNSRFDNRDTTRDSRR